jgi:hypothetical protein
VNHVEQTATGRISERLKDFVRSGCHVCIMQPFGCIMQEVQRVQRVRGVRGCGESGSPEGQKVLTARCGDEGGSTGVTGLLARRVVRVGRLARAGCLTFQMRLHSVHAF